MRETKGKLNGEEFLKIKPDLRKNAIRGIVTAEIIDSKSGEIVESCQSENVITDSFYRNAAAFFAEDFINGSRMEGTPPRDRSFFGTFVANNQEPTRLRSFGLLILSKTGLPESENPKFVLGEIAGTAVVSNNVSRAESWAGNLRNPQSMPTVDENNNVHFTRKFEFTAPKIVNRPFDTLYWLPDHITHANTNLARVVPSDSVVRFDSGSLTAINGAGSFWDTKSATLLPSVVYSVPSGVTIQGWGTRWADMPYCFARGHSGNAANSLVILKYDTQSGELVERRNFVITSSSYNFLQHGRTYVGFTGYGIHPITGSSNTIYIVRCNNLTGEIDISGSQVGNCGGAVFNESGDFRLSSATTFTDFETGERTVTFSADDVDIPKWLYPTNNIRPTVGIMSTGVDTFDVSLSNTYFGTVIATFDYDMSFIMLQNATGRRYRGVAFSDATTTASTKEIPPPPTVMYKFPTTISKNENQVLIITYELVIPSEIVDVKKNFLW